ASWTVRSPWRSPPRDRSVDGGKPPRVCGLLVGDLRRSDTESRRHRDDGSISSRALSCEKARRRPKPTPRPATYLLSTVTFRNACVVVPPPPPTMAEPPPTLGLFWTQTDTVWLPTASVAGIFRVTLQGTVDAEVAPLLNA